MGKSNVIMRKGRPMWRTPYRRRSKGRDEREEVGQGSPGDVGWGSRGGTAFFVSARIAERREPELIQVVLHVQPTPKAGIGRIKVGSFRIRGNAGDKKKEGRAPGGTPAARGIGMYSQTPVASRTKRGRLEMTWGS